MKTTSYLILEDGSEYKGYAFGAEPPSAAELANAEKTKGAAGEVVFNTGMTGYHEILTDPSYKGQIVCMTYPHIGNYGCDEAWNESGPEKPVTAQHIKASGFVVRSLYDGPVPENRASLVNFLKKYGISGISDIDTRKLTLRIRDQGSPNGIIIKSKGDIITEEEKKQCLDFLKSFPSMEGRDLVSDLGTVEPVVVNPQGAPHICLIDCGTKANIVNEMVEIGCKVTVVPNRSTVAQVRGTKADGVLFSNGPGDPAVLGYLVELAKGLMGNMPVFGICLGHQIIGQALGAKTFKMKFGHHGINNPVRDEKTGMVLITSQNHGFSVDEKSLAKDVEVRFRNVNDQTVEGLAHKKLPVLTVQFHPEAAPGPRDSSWIFKEFLSLMG